LKRANLRRKWSTIPRAAPASITRPFHNESSRFTAWRLFVSPRSRLFELACVLVRFHHIDSRIVNAAERSARNSESEVNGNRSVSWAGRAGLITSISAPMFPAFKPLPKVHDYTLLFTRNGRAPYILRCVAEIVTGNGWKTVYSRCPRARGRHLGSGRLIPTGERSGLLTRIAATESVSSCTPMNS
jgi:hypothetical protein